MFGIFLNRLFVIRDWCLLNTNQSENNKPTLIALLIALLIVLLINMLI